MAVRVHLCRTIASTLILNRFNGSYKTAMKGMSITKLLENSRPTILDAIMASRPTGGVTAPAVSDSMTPDEILRDRLRKIEALRQHRARRQQRGQL
jgi:hypothetical protein